MKKRIHIPNTVAAAQAGLAFLRTPKFAVCVTVVVLLAFVVWVVPKPRGRVVPVTGNARWADSETPRQRQIVWQPSKELSSIVPSDMADASLIAPRFADGGTVLYFTLRSPGGQSDIYRSQLSHGEWQTAKPVTSLNSSSDDIAAIPSANGQQLLLYSNRPGGAGGFDIYVSQWNAGDWTPPVNIGTPVNSTADEYDPAISPDGCSLYFASNRDRDAAGLKGSDAFTSGSRGTDSFNSAGDAWSGTLRHRESSTFDLYAAVRNDADSPWQSATALEAVNDPHSNEGAPFISPNGAFLYFASDRAVRSGEDRNLDLFRTIIAGNATSSPENLGPGINTSAHETEPALSPEGFTLVFSAHRGGHERLLLSRAEEVRFETAWDVSNLDSISGIWRQALLLTLLAVVLAAIIFAGRQRFARAAASARFIAGSAIFHVLLIFLLAIWNLPRVIEVITSKKFDAEASTQLFDDNQHQSHVDGRAEYEKLADLKSLEDVPQSEIMRQETEMFSVPERTDSPLPTIPLEVARRLPPERLQFIPPNRTQEQRPSPRDESIPALARPTPQISQAVPDLAIAAVELPVPVELPGERPIATQIDMPRTEQPIQPVEFDIKIAKAPKIRMQSSTDLTPPAVEIGLERKAATLPSNPLEMRVSPILNDTEFVNLDESVVLPAAPVETVQKVTEEPVLLTNVDKVSATTPDPVPFATAGERMKTRQPQAFVEQNAPIAIIENRPSDPSKIPLVPARETAPSPISNPLAGVAQIETEEVLMVDVESSDSAEQAKSTDNGPKLALDRVESIGPAPLTPEKMTGPSSRAEQHIVVGALSLERNNAPPTFNTLASQLDRPLARATAVSLAADSVGLRSMFTLRQGDTRKQYIELFGGTEETEKAVNRGLVWLAQHQNADGSWSLNRFQENCNGKHPTCTAQGAESSNTAATGMALLPFLAAGNTHVEGEHAKVVAAGLQWLIDHQKPDGELLGPGDGQKMYSQGIAAIALCEAFGMTQEPAFREPAERALQYIINAQHKQTGGWRYNPGDAGDTSVVGWQVMALKSGEMAGLAIPADTQEGVRRWLKSVEGNQPVGGKFGYVDRNVSPAMSAEGLLCLQFLDTSRNDPAMRAGADYLLTQLPEISQGPTSYYWYYGTQVMYHMQGNYWQKWNAALRDMVVETQIKDGHMAGTWNPIDSWEHRGGRVYSTSIKLLLLEIYYRHLPLYEQLDD